MRQVLQGGQNLLRTVLNQLDGQKTLVIHDEFVQVPAQELLSGSLGPVGGSCAAVHLETMGKNG